MRTCFRKRRRNNVFSAHDVRPAEKPTGRAQARDLHPRKIVPRRRYSDARGCIASATGHEEGSSNSGPRTREARGRSVVKRHSEGRQQRRSRSRLELWGCRKEGWGEREASKLNMESSEAAASRKPAGSGALRREAAAALDR